jgi:hypothetical protein
MLGSPRYGNLRACQACTRWGLNSRLQRTSGTWGEFPQDWTRFAVPRQQDLTSFVSEVESILQLGHAGTYYELLGVQSETPRAEVKRRFYQLARRFHPDHNMDRLEMTLRLEAVMDLLTLAYKTLSDDRAKKKYDLQLAKAGVPKHWSSLKLQSGSTRTISRRITSMPRRWRR